MNTKHNTRQTPASRVLLAALLASIGSGTGLRAAAITWDNGGADQLWSNSVNWNPDSAAAGNDITFSATGVAAAGTTTNTVDANTSINSLLWSNTGGSGSAQTTTINSGITLTVSGTTSPSVQVNSSTVASSVYAVVNGAGALAVTGGSTVNFNVGQTNLGGSGTQTLDMSGLSSFSADVGAMNLGNGQRNTANVSLAATNTITATSIQLGGNLTTGGPGNTQFNLGTTNTIKADTITVGTGRTGADMKFQTGLSGATITVTNRAGSGAANLNMGLLDINASGGPNSTLDLSGGTANLTLGTVTIGRSANSNAGGSSTGTLTFGAGAISATAVTLGLGNTGTSTTATGFGVITMNSSAGTLTATTVTLGKLATGARNNDGNGTINQNGGIAAITTLNFADGTGNTGSGDATGIYNLAAGTLKAGTIQSGTVAGTGVYTRTFNWTGGTIQNLNNSTNLTVSGVNITTTGAGTQTFSVDSTRSITVNSNITGTGGFIKSGPGSLILAGTNNYTGGTVVNQGGVTFDNTFTMSGANAFSLAGAASPVSGTDYGAIAATAGTFTYGGSLTFNFTGTGVSGASYDLFNTTGATLGGSSFTGVSISGSYSSAFTGSSGIWSTTVGGLNWTFTESTGDLVLTSAIPEPSTWAALAGLSGLAFAAGRRRRRAA